MLSRKSKSTIGMTAARGIVTDPEIRSAAAEVGPPMAKLGFSVGKRLTRRRARRRMKQLSETAGAVSSVASTYAPQVARQLGLIEPEKKKRTAPRVAAGAVIGAGLMYVFEPQHGREHRERLQRIIVSS